MFAGNFPPRGWAECDGQLLSISSNTALFSILGTTYGGDGEVTFGLPDLRGRFPMHEGNGPGLSNRPLGQKSGGEYHTAATSHTHPINVPASSAEGETGQPGGANLAAGEFPAMPYGPGADVSLAAFNSGAAGAGSVNHMNPYQTVTFCIALTGTYPSRN